jgi:hypothetical protein
MIAPLKARTAAPAVLIATLAALAGAGGAHAQEGTSVGGTVTSTLGLSLGEPSPLTRTHTGRRRRSLYTASVPVEVTATDTPTRLSIADGEASAGRRLGCLVRGRSILAAPLRAAADHGHYRSLHARVDPVLEQWREPVSLAAATIRLRQSARGAASTLRSYHKLLLVTVTAGGP